MAIRRVVATVNLEQSIISTQVKKEKKKKEKKKHKAVPLAKHPIFFSVDDKY